MKISSLRVTLNVWRYPDKGPETMIHVRIQFEDGSKYEMTSLPAPFIENHLVSGFDVIWERIGCEVKENLKRQAEKEGVK